MSAGNQKSSDRLAATLFALLKSATGRRQMPVVHHQAARQAVNSVLERLGDNVLAETLHELYRLAEADARKQARSSAILHARLAPKRIILDPPNSNGSQS